MIEEQHRCPVLWAAVFLSERKCEKMLLELQHIGKFFGEDEILHDITATLHNNDRVGLIGANGAGKTTLLHIICGLELPDEGKIQFFGNARVGYLEQNGGLLAEESIWQSVQHAFDPALKAIQLQEELQSRLAKRPDQSEDLGEQIAACISVIDAFDAYNMDIQIKKVLRGMDFPSQDWDKRTDKLSGGEQTRLRLARLLLSHYELLILDEPTNHLDITTMEWLEAFLQSYRGAVLVVSHDRYFLDSICTRIWELREHCLHSYRGNYSTYLPLRQAADERKRKQHEADIAKAAKLQDYVNRNLARASTTKMAQSRRKQLEKMQIEAAPKSEARDLDFRFAYDMDPYKDVVIIKDLCVRIENRTLFEDLNLTVHRAERLIIAGPNGAGKSTLLQVLCGKRLPVKGSVQLGIGTKVGIFEQQQADRPGRVIDALWNRYPRMSELEIRNHLARFGFRGEEILKDCISLSGGERARLRFAELALERPNLLLLDEPTNHLDIYMRESLTDALMAYKGTLLLITHDRWLMQTFGCPILYIESGSATLYPDFAAFHTRETAAPIDAILPGAERENQSRLPYGKEDRRHRAEVRNQIKAVEKEIEELDLRIAGLESALNDPTVLRNYRLTKDKTDELTECRIQQQERFDEWEKLLREQERFTAPQTGVD